MGKEESKIRELMQEIGNEIKEFFRTQKEEIGKFVKPVLILFTILSVSSIAIFRANFNYIDDALRVANGKAGWSHFSRYISEGLSHLIHTAAELADISPLSQLLGLLFVSVAGIALIYAVTGDEKIRMISIVAVIPLGFSPYFMECLSYKYDAAYMALSILGAVVPVLFFRKKLIPVSLAALSSSLIVCMTYQGAIGIYPMLILFLAYKDWNDREDWKEIGKRVLCAAGGYLLGLLIFRFFIMHPIAEADYVSGSLFPLAQLVPGAFGRYVKYFLKIWNDFPMAWRIPVLVLCAGFIVVATGSSKRNKVVSCFLSILVLVLMACLSYGIFPFLQKEFYPARAMYGFGAFLAVIAVYQVTRRKTFLLQVFAVGLSWCFVVFAFVYGNALSVQKEYSDFRMERVIDDLNDLEVFRSGEEITVDIDGSYARSPLLSVADRNFPLLQQIVPQPFCSIEWIWSTMEFETKYAIPNMRVVVDLPEMELPLIKDTMYQTIYGDEHNICVVLK